MDRTKKKRYAYLTGHRLHITGGPCPSRRAEAAVVIGVLLACGAVQAHALAAPVHKVLQETNILIREAK